MYVKIFDWLVDDITNLVVEYRLLKIYKMMCCEVFLHACVSFFSCFSIARIVCNFIA